MNKKLNILLMVRGFGMDGIAKAKICRGHISSFSSLERNNYKSI